MPDQTADKVHDGDCLLNVFFVLMPVVIKGDILSVIVQDALCRDHRTAKISADILKDFGRFTFFGFCIYVESVLMIPINSSFCLFKRVAKSFVQQAEESGLERVPEQLVVKVMDIPPECMININTTLSLLNSKKFKKAFEKYKELEKLSIEVMKDEHHVEQAFMSYVLYIVQKKKKTYEKNDFYKYYSPLYYIFDPNMDHLPFSFSSEQMKLFFNTSFGSVFEILNQYIQEEVTNFEKKIFNKSINSEEYLKYRISTIQNSFEINKTLNIVPTFEEIKDKFNTFSVPSLIPNFITDKPVDFDIKSLGPKSRTDLVEIDFYKPLIFVYKKFAKKIGEDDSDMGACKLILKYITKLKENYELITKDKIRKEFYTLRDIENVYRIIEGEKTI